MIRDLVRTRVGRLRRSLPDPAVRAARRLVSWWGWLTADLRPPPAVIVVGAQRAGTTTMFRLLSGHPQLRRPTQVKGTGYFDDHYHRGFRSYRSHFPLRLPFGRGADRSAFECSGYYLFHPLAAERIARDLPGVHVIVMVRDPVARAYSAYRHEHARGFETLPFEDAIARERERTRGEAERLAVVPGAVSYEHRHHAYLQRSEYAGQIDRFVDALGAEQVHVVDADALFHDPVGVFTGLQRRLGLRVWRPPEVRRWNERPGPALPDHVLTDLRHHFDEHDAALSRLLGGPPTWRKEPTP